METDHQSHSSVTYEMSDVEIRGIVTFIIALSILTIVVYFLMWGMFRLLTGQEVRKEKEAATSRMVMNEQERRPPEPRLQSARGFGEELEKEVGKESEGTSDTPKSPLWEINTLHEHWDDVLQHGIKDADGKVIAVPIDEAKKQLLSDPTLSSGTATATPGAGAEAYGVDMPTAASSGRTTEKRRE